MRDSSSTFVTGSQTSYQVRTSLLTPSSDTHDPLNPPDDQGPVKLKEKLQRYWSSVVKTRLPKGWRFGAVLAALMSSCALTINVAVAILAWVWTRHRGHKSNIEPVYTGKCSTVDNLGLVVHLVINIVSTLLLGANNYCMQIVCAPTRKEIDRAHKKGSWLDIGVQSFSNLKRAKKIKRFTWLMLGLSSVPLHFM